MTIGTDHYDGWMIHPDYRNVGGADTSAPLRRCPKHLDLPAALEMGRQLRTRSIFKRVMDFIEGTK